MKFQCFECISGKYNKVVKDFVSLTPDGELVVPDIEFLVCDTCGDECLASEPSKKIDEFRFKNGFTTRNLPQNK